MIYDARACAGRRMLSVHAGMLPFCQPAKCQRRHARSGAAAGNGKVCCGNSTDVEAPTPFQDKTFNDDRAQDLI
ncbi:hypothetical protein NPIL_483191 [Nephila pilipes]|uniref:Uncharacterized protein n=1 Tax=Nephila pilipes TaxID=299642 RepID=A0A8X6U1V8_NEPPI|nr:hypothetical protein NPIL_483191 [Nephila pilipes]